ncbi:MAG: phage integrase SAM-like domain-containing protein, partial [Flavobacteriaceae bacterium]|nr:phage integrase SAM-like domain-containing protein [Flavobacteriaceae bacterium]
MNINKVKWTKVNLQYNRIKNQWQIIYSAKSIPLGEDENGVRRYKPVRKAVNVPIPLGYYRTYDPQTKQEINLPRDKKSHNDKREAELRMLEAEHQRDLTNGIYRINQVRISGERICDWINNWMEEKTMSKNTREGYGVLANHLRKVGNIHFISFDSSYINKFIKHLNDLRDVGKMGQSTIREYRDRLKYVMHEAERRKKIINVQEIFDEANDVPYGDTSI